MVKDEFPEIAHHLSFVSGRAENQVLQCVDPGILVHDDTLSEFSRPASKSLKDMAVISPH